MKQMKLAGMLAVVLIMIAVIAGCGNNEKSPSGSQSSGGQQTNGGENIKLVMTHWGSETDNKTYRERLDLAQSKYPHIEVELMHVTGDYDQRLQTMIAGGNAPDIIQLAESMQAYASKGQIVPLDALAQGTDLDGWFDAETLNIFKYDGQLYAMPDRAGAMIMYYNKDMFDAAKLDYPSKDWKWDDLVQAAKTLTLQENGEITQWGYMNITWWPYWMSYVYQNGGRVLDENGKPVFNTPEVKEALQWLVDSMYADHYAPTPVEVADMGNPGPDQLFAQGKLAMEITGFWNIQSLRAVPELNWDIAPIFGNKERGTSAFFGGFSITKDSKEQQAAYQIIEFLSSPEGQMPIVENGQDVPANKVAMSSDEFLNASWLEGLEINMGAFADSAQAVYVPPLHPQWNEIMKIIDDQFGLMFNQDASIDESVDIIQSGLEQLLK